MQGTVLDVEVADGDEVEPGQVICIVEAMKMENEIAAHRAGVVAKLSVAPGAAVASGQVICLVAEAMARPGRSARRSPAPTPSRSQRRRAGSTTGS